MSMSEPTGRSRKPWHDPYCFYGTVWTSPARKTLSDYVRDGELDVQAAALLVALAGAPVSIVVVSTYSGIGKSTLLRALLDHAAADAELIFLRGGHEPFTFLAEQPRVTSRMRLIVANEISPHLPVYTWGCAAQRALTLSAQPGYALRATAHASSRRELLALWSEPPVSVDLHDEAQWPVVVMLDPADVEHGSQLWRGVKIEIGGVGLDASGCLSTASPNMPNGFSEIDALCHAVWNQVGSVLWPTYLDARHLAWTLDDAVRLLLEPPLDKPGCKHEPLSPYASRTP